MKNSSIFTDQADSTKIQKIIFYNETYIILTKNEKSFKSSPTSQAGLCRLTNYSYSMKISKSL